MKLQKILNNKVVFSHGNKIITKPITKEAQVILDWYNKNIPSNVK